MTASPTIPTTAPPTVKSRRRPNRERVRSLHSPVNGPVIVVMIAAMPMMYPSTSTCDGASCWIRSDSDRPIGATSATYAPNIASSRKTTYFAFTGARNEPVGV